MPDYWQGNFRGPPEKAVIQGFCLAQSVGLVFSYSQRSHFMGEMLLIWDLGCMVLSILFCDFFPSHDSFLCLVL